MITIVQQLLLDERNLAAVSPALIAEKMNCVLRIAPNLRQGLDHDGIVDELTRRFSVWMGKDTALNSTVGHEAWLNATRKSGWRYWQRYREWIEQDLSWKEAEALDLSTDTVLGFLEDPLRDGPWDRRGLVVGHVQAGKTAHYTGLLCKAADAGYKIVIVLAGLHNNLRSQTQMRLECGFLGYKTPVEDALSILGVGTIDSDKDIHPNCATNRSNSGDFCRRIANNLAISPEQRPWLFVVKKNKAILRELLKWIQNHAADTNRPNLDPPHAPADGLPLVRRVVTRLPLLVIDDEADHASVDTQEKIFDENGIPDEEHSPTTINKLIRRILGSFSRSAYVGYTATPFANIFIHERGETREEGQDLFPSAFIVNLATSSNYVGPAKMFGSLTPDGRKGGMPLLRRIEDLEYPSDYEEWIPQKHPNGHLPRYMGDDCLPPSLIQAIDSFLLTCTIRTLRGQHTKHSSMLIHVTRFNSVQREVCRQVNEHILHTRQRILRNIDSESTWERLRKVWEDDYLPTTESIRRMQEDLVPAQDIAWGELVEALPGVLSDIEIRMINGTAKDMLDYENHKSTGLKVIAIGGDKLARGLTLEGLSVSYFLRASKMYDTLMQMGRWFGYRPGYLDLCRLYTTSDLAEWFGHITDAADELREEFDLMVASGATPRDYGIKVQSHPVLMVTSRLKMRSARNLMLSFSGQLFETVAFFRDRDKLNKNLLAAQKLIENLGGDYREDPTRLLNGRPDKWSGLLWTGVPAALIIGFLQDYETHPIAYKVNSAMLAEFINRMVEVGELTKWTVALASVKSGVPYTFTSEVAVGMNKRSGDAKIVDRYSIGRLLDPKDESIDLSDAEWKAALSYTQAAYRPDPTKPGSTTAPEIPNGPAIRRIRGFGAQDVQAHPERGLLILYALDPAKAGIGFDKDTPPVVGVGISFPGSDSGLKVEYKVNNVLWEQEYGPAE